jgi:hypothetical protein
MSCDPLKGFFVGNFQKKYQKSKGEGGPKLLFLKIL